VWNVYRDRITTAGRQRTLVRVANNQKVYIVERRTGNAEMMREAIHTGDERQEETGQKNADEDMT